MSEAFAGLSPIVQAGLAALFTWSMTALGAAAVFFFRDLNRRILDAALGFTAGVMIAASFWSLLAPSIAIPEGLAIGVAFGSVGAGLGTTTLGAATALPSASACRTVRRAQRSRCPCAAMACRED